MKSIATPNSAASGPLSHNLKQERTPAVCWSDSLDDMQTPNTIEGAITEDIMRRAVQKLVNFPTHNYNRLYEAVLESLNANLPAARQAPPEMDGETFAGMQRIMAIV